MNDSLFYCILAILVIFMIGPAIAGYIETIRRSSTDQSLDFEDTYRSPTILEDHSSYCYIVYKDGSSGYFSKSDYNAVMDFPSLQDDIKVIFKPKSLNPK